MDDSEAPSGERQYHLEVADGEVPSPVLLPGDPERVETITALWDDVSELAHHREYRTVAGRYDDTALAVTSTGIGSPSAAIAVEELARVGVDTVIRVGSCGVLKPNIDIGDLVITTAAVRQEGTSDEYVREDYPAAADDRVVGALIAAAEALDYPYHTGITLSTDSFYAGQARPGYGGYRAPGSDELLESMQAANVVNVEMEASAICTLGQLYGLRAGAICTAYANRETGKFGVTGERRAAEVASKAASILAGMDRRVAETDADRWHPGLGYKH